MSEWRTTTIETDGEIEVDDEYEPTWFERWGTTIALLISGISLGVTASLLFFAFTDDRPRINVVNDTCTRVILNDDVVYNDCED